jgi:hypothetical protein
LAFSQSGNIERRVERGNLLGWDYAKQGSLKIPCTPVSAGEIPFYKFIRVDDLVKSQQNDGFVKGSPATGGTRRAKTEE